MRTVSEIQLNLRDEQKRLRYMKEELTQAKYDLQDLRAKLAGTKRQTYVYDQTAQDIAEHTRDIEAMKIEIRDQIWHLGELSKELEAAKGN
jgi:DNA repair ATPase RecN